MRPSKHQPFSLCNHLFRRNGVFYYRSNIPTDLQKYFPTTEIKKSFKTKNLKLAKGMAVGMEFKLQQTYALIRSGMLSTDIIQGMVAELYPGKKLGQPKGVLLASLMEDYVKVQESKWTFKTKLEVLGCFRLITDVMGNVEAKAITRQSVLDFRAKLMKLPPNIYKVYPNQTIDQILVLPDTQGLFLLLAGKYHDSTGTGLNKKTVLWLSRCLINSISRGMRSRRSKSSQWLNWVTSSSHSCFTRLKRCRFRNHWP